MVGTLKQHGLLPARIHITDVIMGAFGLFIVALMVYGSFVSITSGKFAGRWMNFVIDGLTLGSVYALIALGYTLVYGILRMINFAHGEVFMAGALTTYYFAMWLDEVGFLNGHPFVSIAMMLAFSATISMTVAFLLERIAYRPLRNAPRLIPLITAIGASFFLQYTFRGLFGSDVKRYPKIDVLEGEWTLGPFSAGSLHIGEIVVEYNQAVVIASALLLMLLLWLFIQRTKMGMAMRAVSEDKEVAALMGIDVDRSIMFTFVIGGALAGAAGVLYALIFGQVHFFMGFIPGLKAFTAAVLGGIGNVPGAMVGGLFLGVVEGVGPFLWLDGLGISSPNQLKDAIAFTMLVLVLIFRPTGIMGERLSKRA
jgi:branched-chain amino acid transport system permease protein